MRRVTISIALLGLWAAAPCANAQTPVPTRNPSPAATPSASPTVPPPPSLLTATNLCIAKEALQYEKFSANGARTAGYIPNSVISFYPMVALPGDQNPAYGLPTNLLDHSLVMPAALLQPCGRLPVFPCDEKKKITRYTAGFRPSREPRTSAIDPYYSVIKSAFGAFPVDSLGDTPATIAARVGKTPVTLAKGKLLTVLSSAQSGGSQTLQAYSEWLNGSNGRTAGRISMLSLMRTFKLAPALLALSKFNGSFPPVRFVTDAFDYLLKRGDPAQIASPAFASAGQMSVEQYQSRFGQVIVNSADKTARFVPYSQDPSLLYVAKTSAPVCEVVAKNSIGIPTQVKVIGAAQIIISEVNNNPVMIPESRITDGEPGLMVSRNTALHGPSPLRTVPGVVANITSYTIW